MGAILFFAMGIVAFTALIGEILQQSTRVIHQDRVYTSKLSGIRVKIFTFSCGEYVTFTDNNKIYQIDASAFLELFEEENQK